MVFVGWGVRFVELKGEKRGERCMGRGGRKFGWFYSFVGLGFYFIVFGV